jgi:hypothetical protein
MSIHLRKSAVALRARKSQLGLETYFLGARAEKTIPNLVCYGSPTYQFCKFECPAVVIHIFGTNTSAFPKPKIPP